MENANKFHALNRDNDSKEINRLTAIILKNVKASYDDIITLFHPYEVRRVVMSSDGAAIELCQAELSRLAVKHLEGKELLGTRVDANLTTIGDIICVEGLSENCTKETLELFMSRHLIMKKCIIYRDASDDQSLGYGFVFSLRELPDISSITDLRLEGQLVRCSIIPESRSCTYDELGSTILVIFNIPPDMNKNQFSVLLEELTQEPIIHVNCQMGKVKGSTSDQFAIVEYANHQQAIIVWKLFNKKCKTNSNSSQTQMIAQFCAPGKSLEDIVQQFENGQYQSPSFKMNPPNSDYSNKTSTFNNFKSDSEKMLARKVMSQSIINDCLLSNFTLMMETCQGLGFSREEMCDMIKSTLKTVSSEIASNSSHAKDTSSFEDKASKTDPGIDIVSNQEVKSSSVEFKPVAADNKLHKCTSTSDLIDQIQRSVSLLSFT